MSTKAKRTRIEDLRRAELIAAAHRVFMKHGLPGLTTARICEEAGMSPGILAYYFKGKDEVLFGMVRHNNRVLMQDVIAKLNSATSRWERFVAVVEGNFPAHAFEPDVAKAWLSVCAAAAGKPEFARLQTIFYARLNSNLASAFASVVGRDRQRILSLAVGALIDGMWLRKAAGGDIGRDEAVHIIVAATEKDFSAAELETLRRPFARER